MDSELLWHIVSKFLSTAYCAAYNLLTGTRLRERSYHEVLGLAKQDIQFADPSVTLLLPRGPRWSQQWHYYYSLRPC
jgi:hypothetical protein